MHKASRMALLIIGVLWSATSLADEAELAPTTSETSTTSWRNIDELFLVSAYVYQLQSLDQNSFRANDDEWRRPLSEIDFQDGSPLGRASRIRSLSFVTFAEVGQARLFLGVNEDGLIGIHFRAFRRGNNTRHLEMMRMPYLRNINLPTR